MSERPRTMTAERRPEIKPYNPYIYHCSHCSREIPLETQEELFAATRVNGVCEYCYSAHYSSEQAIRKALWLGHGHDGLYGDDGEMQCNLGGCMLDYKRDPLDKIIAQLFQQRDSSEHTIQEQCAKIAESYPVGGMAPYAETLRQKIAAAIRSQK